MTGAATNPADFGRRSVFLSLAAGALLPVSFAPFNIWPALIAALALSFWLIKDITTLKQGFFCGWLIGVGKYAVGASWIYVSIHDQGGASDALAGVLVGVFVAGMALFSGIFGALFGLSNSPEANRWLRIALFAAAWVVAEWCLTWLLTGFPWLFSGYGLMSTWLIGFGPIVGVLGLGFIACLLGGSLVDLVTRASGFGQRAVLLVCCTLLVAGGYLLQGVSWVELDDAQDVALVQGNIEQISKWNPENRLPILETYQALTEPHWNADLIIWPEAAITLFADQAAPWLNRWSARGARTGTTLVLGVPDVETQADGQSSFQNTALALGEGSGRYIKRRLVPFGEYVPLESVLRGLITFFDLPMSRSGSGPDLQPPILAGDTSLGTAICYEIAYPELVRQSARNADVLITISNDAWFGASIGPHQHLQLAQMRAIENARFVLRATNNGLTAIINERGEITEQLAQFEPGVLRGEFSQAKGQTPFAMFGHWPVLILAALLIGHGLSVIAYRCCCSVVVYCGTLKPQK